MSKSDKSQYDQSGVSSTGAETALSGLLKHVLPTRKFSDRYPLAADIGYFANVIDLGNGEGIAFGTDGVGTKIIVAELLNRYDTIGIDCVAMNVNDVICVGASPVSMVDYIACSHTDTEIFNQLGKGLAEGARQSNISISGVEISQIREIISGIDLIGACIGHVSLNKVNTWKNIQFSFIMPFGYLREPIKNLKRANFIYTTKGSKKHSSLECFQTKHIDIEFELIKYDQNSIGNKQSKIEKKENQRLVAFAGIANPKHFFEILNQLEIVPDEKIIFQNVQSIDNKVTKKSTRNQKKLEK